MLEGKVVVVLGGAGLLGGAITRECLSRGATTIVADIADPHIDGAIYLQCDATDESSVVALAEKIQKEYGAITGVVNATYPKTPAFGKDFEKSNIDDILENVSLHIKTCLVAIRAFEKRMVEGGSIVFFGSIYGVVAPRFEIYEGTSMTVDPAYPAAKGGIVALVRYFAALLGPKGIRINAISPGGITDNQPETFTAAYSKKVLLGSGLLAPSDIAGVAAFLLSDASSKMTGQNLVVDAGWTL